MLRLLQFLGEKNIALLVILLFRKYLDLIVANGFLLLLVSCFSLLLYGYIFLGIWFCVVCTKGLVKRTARFGQKKYFFLP